MPAGGVFSWLRSPAVHFAVLGSVLFLLKGALGPETLAEGLAPRTPIVISAERIDTLRDELQRGGTEPEPEGLRARIRQDVDEEILYREARRLSLDAGYPSVRRSLVQKMLALNDRPGRSEEALVREARQLGLDDDTVIRRLLIEKMRILLREARDPEPVSDDALLEVLIRHRDRFEQPAQLALTQVFLAGEAGAELAVRAEGMRRKLAGRAPSAFDLGNRGDPFPLGQELRGQSRTRIQARFGEAFAEAVFALEPGYWSQPIESPYGLHLVWVADKLPDRLPPLDQVRSAIALTLAKERAAGRLAQAMGRLRSLYPVHIEADDEAAAAEIGAPAGSAT